MSSAGRPSSSAKPATGKSEWAWGTARARPEALDAIMGSGTGGSESALEEVRALRKKVEAFTGLPQVDEAAKARGLLVERDQLPERESDSEPGGRGQ